MKIVFHPSHDDDMLVEATRQYQNIWDAEGERIVKATETKTGLKFTENNINAIIFEGVSQSHPLAFRASYDDSTKKATIVHELMHRICAYKLKFPDEKDSTAMSFHKIIYLLLYEIWVELYGQEFAQDQVEMESSRSTMYKISWDWALSMTAEKRHKLFDSLKK